VKPLANGDRNIGLKVYTLYIYDDRYSVPTIDLLMADNDAEAEVAARERLAASPHHRAVAAFEDDRFVCETPERGAGERSLAER
jgi:hypothetical protein